MRDRAPVVVDNERRISLTLPCELVDRLERQAEMLGTSRTQLIETACVGLVREFEQIDAEEANRG